MRLSQLMVSILAIFSRSSINAGNKDSKCITPSGDYEGSCTAISVQPYVSVDELVPPTCKLDADCATMFTGLPPSHNTVYFPQNTLLKNVSNKNGTLTHAGKALVNQNHHSKLKEQYTCYSPQGSYSETCTTDTTPYLSSDENLRNAEICRAQLACKTLQGESSSTLVYFNIKARESETTVQKIENCDGLLVTHPIDDNRCSNEESDKIKEISEREGKQGTLVL
jgi:hypothetical protein